MDLKQTDNIFIYECEECGNVDCLKTNDSVYACSICGTINATKKIITKGSFIIQSPEINFEQLDDDTLIPESNFDEVTAILHNCQKLGWKVKVIINDQD